MWDWTKQSIAQDIWCSATGGFTAGDGMAMAAWTLLQALPNLVMSIIMNLPNALGLRRFHLWHDAWAWGFAMNCHCRA